MKPSPWIARLLPVRPCQHPARHCHVHDGETGTLFCETCCTLVRVRGSFIRREYGAPEEVHASHAANEEPVGPRITPHDLSQHGTNDMTDVDHGVIPFPKRYAVGRSWPKEIA